MIASGDLRFQSGRPKSVSVQTVQIQMRWLVTSRLIWIYIVCHSVFDFRLKPLFVSVGKPEFKNGIVHFRNSGMKGLKILSLLNM